MLEPSSWQNSHKGRFQLQICGFLPVVVSVSVQLRCMGISVAFLSANGVHFAFFWYTRLGERKKHGRRGLGIPCYCAIVSLLSRVKTLLDKTTWGNVSLGNVDRQFALATKLFNKQFSSSVFYLNNKLNRKKTSGGLVFQYFDISIFSRGDRLCKPTITFAPRFNILSGYFPSCNVYF